MKRFWVYMLASKHNGTLYVGVTSNLSKRIWEHRNRITEGFTDKHDVHRLVYFEEHENAESAITREKQIKKWERDWKKNLIERENPHWEDLYNNIANG